MSAYKSLYNELVEKTENLKANDYHYVDDEEEKSEWDKIIEEAKVKCEHIKDCIRKLKELQKQLDEKYKKVKPMIKKVGPLLAQLDQLTQLENLLQRLENIKQVHEILEQNCIDIKDKEFDNKINMIINAFNSIKNEYENAKSHHSEPLKQYIEKVIVHWSDILKEKLGKKFEQILVQIHWPFGVSLTTSALKTSSVNSDSINLFCLYFNALLTVDIENDLSKKESSNIIICLPINQMVKPLKKRFHFHFMETKSKLNNPEKVFHI